MVRTRVRAAAEVEGTPTGGSGPGANWTADLARRRRPSFLNVHAGQDLLGVRIPVLSGAAAGLAVLGALLSLALGFLILAEDFGSLVPNRWVAVFAASSGATIALFVVAVVSGRGRRAWRNAADARFGWETLLSILAAVVFGVATALSDGFPGYLCLAAILAAYVTLARWTWWTWRASC